MKTTLQSLISLFALLLVVSFTADFRPVANESAKPVTQKTATLLTNYFRKDYSPLKAAQIETMNAPAFENWLSQSTLPTAQKNSLRRYLQPVLSNGSFQALSIRKAQPLRGKIATAIAIIQIPSALSSQMQGTDYVIIASSEDPWGTTQPQETCQYNSCYCSSGKPGDCTTTTQFNKVCPPSECTGSPCNCGGGGGLSLDQVFQTLNE